MENMREILETYAAMLRDEKRVSQNTVLSYRRDLDRLLLYLQEQGVEDYAAVTETMLARYLHGMEYEGKSPATVSRAASSIRAFFRYLLQSGVLAGNPAERLKAPHVEKKAPHILTPQETVRLLRQPQGDTPKALRDRAMLELLYATGIRAGELVGLRISDLNLAMEYVSCRQGGRERAIPFGKMAKGALQIYLEQARPRLIKEEDSGLLFVNLSGGKMSRQGVWKLVKQYGRAAGIDGELTPHTLRHSFAAHLVGNGADLFAVQEMMGYTDLSSAQIYAQMNRPSIRAAYKKAHPRE